MLDQLAGGILTTTLKRNNTPEVSLGKVLLNIRSKCTGIFEITLLHGCSPVNLLHIFRTLFPKNTSGGLFLNEKISNFKFSLL